MRDSSSTQWLRLLFKPFGRNWLKTFLSRVMPMTIVIEILAGGGVAVVPMSRFYFQFYL
jgi:hypothetical protein